MPSEQFAEVLNCTQCPFAEPRRARLSCLFHIFSWKNNGVVLLAEPFPVAMASITELHRSHSLPVPGFLFVFHCQMPRVLLKAHCHIVQRVKVLRDRNCDSDDFSFLLLFFSCFSILAGSGDLDQQVKHLQ